MWAGLTSSPARVAALALVLAALLTSCGSGGGSEPTVISRAQFLVKAQAICEKGSTKIGKRYAYWAERAHLHADSEGFMNKMAAKVVLPLKVRQVQELRALSLPEAGKKKIEAFLAAMEEGIETGKKDTSSSGSAITPSSGLSKWPKASA